MGTIFKTISEEVNFFYPLTRIGIIILALLVCFLPLPSLILHVLAITLILTVGLMHGATDHILYLNAQGLTSNSPIPKRFFMKYLVTILGMVLIWWLLPSLALGLFVVTSAYHFGQTQWQYIDLPESSPIKKAIYTTWGLLILSLIVVLNAEESNVLLNSFLSQVDVSSFTPVIYLSMTLWIVLLISIRSIVRWDTLLLEILELIIISLFSWKTDLLVSFGLFFGMWHALRASQVQIDKIKENQSFEKADFIKKSIPFTLISLIGIFLLIYFSQSLNESIKPEMLFLIAISALTMPHMVIYEEFYDAHSSKN